VKPTLFTLTVVFCLGLPGLAQSSHPAPVGMRHAQELDVQNDKGFPPLGSLKSAIDIVTLQREADQLASLAASVPPGVQNASKGLLAKDLLQKFSAGGFNLT
jgi:hypothetical protein